jgi:hypothetical protein
MLVRDPKSGTRTLSSFFSAPAKYDKPPNLWNQIENQNPVDQKEIYFKAQNATKNLFNIS